jgi:hypothetical protein
MTTIDICPACGYPKFGPGLCAYCVPVQAMIEDHTFVSMPGAGQPRFSQARATPWLGHGCQRSPEALGEGIEVCCELDVTVWSGNSLQPAGEGVNELPESISGLHHRSVWAGAGGEREVRPRGRSPLLPRGFGFPAGGDRWLMQIALTLPPLGTIRRCRYRAVQASLGSRSRACWGLGGWARSASRGIRGYPVKTR